MKLKTGLKILFVLGILLTIFMFNSSTVKATTPDADMLDEAIVPTEFVFTEKEIEFDTIEIWQIAQDLKAELEGLGYDFTGYSLNTYFAEIPMDGYTGYDIHQVKISLLNNSDYTEIASKTVPVTYSNTGDYLETDEEYVRNNVASKWFYRYQWKELGSEEESLTYEHIVSELIDDDTIQVKILEQGGWGSALNGGYTVTVLFFKEDVLYGMKRGNNNFYYSVTIPNETKENTQSYINYALPKILEFLGESNLTLQGTILAESTDTTEVTEYNNYYKVNIDSSVTEYEEEDRATLTFTNAYFSQFFDVVDADGGVWGTVILLKPNVLIVTQGVTVNAELPQGITVVEVSEEMTEEVINRMMGQLGATKILVAYELQLTGEFDGPITVTFALGTEYNGKTVYILHQKHNGEYETFIETVVEGSVTITVDELSPFIIALADDIPALHDEPRMGEANIVGLIGMILLISLAGMVVFKFKK